ncbi:DEAD/DEAH box helicase [Photobacterium phosphoreum]|uniref:DEAD/DEAH box helicase n=1 Tax=Photobacterium phosphoreum TaxID=659 RepID=UPI0007F9436D|nr:DEAD/DEAH box helicase [Photobacterium phosphoreum]OBU31955.1 hypothetical protein AYY24_19460 [Photobacterium phosphoreum]OBU47323.1 hypothetical protein AYY26_11825 [Photobacterium phosphoreum]PSW32698.1 hypothetical protein CTM87_19880 [Photobacterium phosphoreum]
MSEWYKESKDKLHDHSFNDWDNFMSSLINEFNNHTNESLVQDIVIRALERKKEIPNAFILDHLLGELGLFPYIDLENSTTKDKIRQSLFTTPQDNAKTFHIRQAEAFHRIMNGENIVLSAPTSFGKSLIIEALIASNEFNNIVIVVPTIALIDELKKKLFKYNEHYKVITQVTQQSGDRNIFIFTQERVLEYKQFSSIDFFIIDEFYKLAPTSKNDERCDRLNLAFRTLHRKCQRFYMLGPKINGLVSGITEELRCTFLQFDSYATVATNEFFYPLKIKSRKDADIDVERDEKLFKILKDIGRDEQTVIYCKSPKRASSLMTRILNTGLLTSDDTNNDLSEWLSDSFHRDWSLAVGVKHGIAYHHAQLPRAVGALIVDLFNDSKINILICTSTLIEGVNTNAKNIVIYDNCIARKKLDMFTFNNISGRSGRMFEHFIGNVFIFGERPQIELPYIDIPVVTQSTNASESLLLHLGEDVKDENQNKVQKFYDQDILPIQLLLKHQGIDPNRLLRFAENLIENCGTWNSKMVWDGIHPNAKQLHHLSVILFKYFNVSSMGGGTVRSNAQLNRKLINIINKVDDKALINQEFIFWHQDNESYTIDDAVQSVFSFKKNLVNYNLPKIIYAISDIQEIIFKRFEYSYGNYMRFTTSLENFYLPAAINSLEEFGIPNQVAKKIIEHTTFEDIDNIDSVLDGLSKIRNTSFSYLTDFEKTFVIKALSYM